MIENITIQNSVVYDYILSMARLAQTESFEESFKNYDKEMIDKFKYDENLLKWIAKTKKAIPQEYQETLDFFFNRQTRWYDLLVYYARRHDYQDIDEFLNFVENKSASEMISKHLFLFSFHFKSFPQITEEEAQNLLHSERNAMIYLEKTKFSSKRKWELLQFCLNPEDKKAELVELLKWYYENIYKNEIKKVAKIIKKYESNLEQKLNKYGNEYLKILVNTDYSHDAKNKDIVLSLSYYTEIGYLIFFMDYTDEDFYVIGFRHMEIFVERKHGILANVNIFKALGDETRQNIIKLLSKKEWYGDELAQEMELSNSTVSYHLSILLLEGFITLNRVENRTYITLNKENLNKLVDEALKRMIGQIKT